MTERANVEGCAQESCGDLNVEAYKKWARKRSLPRVDSLADQLRDVAIEANKIGCYDAADAINRWLENTEGKL